MRDPRFEIFTSSPITVSTATTTNGATLNLLTLGIDVDGDYWEGAPAGYGLGVEVMFYDVTSTNNNVTLKWQVSDDGSTWVDDQQVFAGELSTLIGDSGTKYITSTRLRTKRQYARLAIVTTGMSGSSFKVNAWVSDGTSQHGFDNNPRI